MPSPDIICNWSMLKKRSFFPVVFVSLCSLKRGLLMVSPTTEALSTESIINTNRESSLTDFDFGTR